MKRPAPCTLIVVGAVLLGSVGCSRKDSLVLLDLRSSGPLGAPVVAVRLDSATIRIEHVTEAISAGDLAAPQSPSPAAAR